MEAVSDDHDPVRLIGAVSDSKIIREEETTRESGRGPRFDTGPDIFNAFSCNASSGDRFGRQSAGQPLIFDGFLNRPNPVEPVSLRLEDSIASGARKTETVQIDDGEPSFRLSLIDEADSRYVDPPFVEAPWLVRLLAYLPKTKHI